MACVYKVDDDMNYGYIFSVERLCTHNICLNEGVCKVDDATRRYQCYCRPGFSGTVCQDVCSLECINGDCIKGDLGREYCHCHDGWSGFLCDVSDNSVEGCNRNSDCQPNERCIENERGQRICVGDPCERVRCENDGKCVSKDDDFVCECVPGSGFTGKFCDNDINECELSPCQNGGTCINVEGSYECLCPDSHKGRNCTEIVSYCATEPCHNAGKCVEMKNGYHCLCSAGFTGKSCEIATKYLCSCPNPYHVCTWKLSGPHCDCPKGYKGATCSIKAQADPCETVRPCLNGGLCTESDTDPLGYECSCLPDFTGHDCGEKRPCLVNGKGCLNGGKCVRGLAVTRCKCSAGFGGPNCEVQQISSSTTSASTSSTTTKHTTASPIAAACQPNPCYNSGVCKPVGDSNEAGFVCDCPEDTTGNFCETVLDWESQVDEVQVTFRTRKPTPEVTSTKSTTTSKKPPVTVTAINEIGGESTISENAIEEEDFETGVSSCGECENSFKCAETDAGAICLCESEFIGAKCDMKGNACEGVLCPATQICRPLIRSTDTNILCGCSIGFGGVECSNITAATFGENSLYIHQSAGIMIGMATGPLPYSFDVTFKTTVPQVHIVSGENIFGQKLFTAGLNGGLVWLNVSGTAYAKLLNLKINDGRWHRLQIVKTRNDLLVTLTEESGHLLLNRTLPRMSAFEIFSTRIGKISDNQHYIGCIADVSIDSNPINLFGSSRGIQIQQGCIRERQCLKNHCHNGGTCVDEWSKASCSCLPPFLPPICLHSLPPSTFGHGNMTSLADVSIPVDVSQHLRFSTDIQMIMRTNKADGAVIYLGEEGHDDVTTYTTIQMLDGKVKVKSKAGARAVNELFSSRRLNDNADHLLKVERRQRHVKLFVDGILEAEGEIQQRFDHPLFIERIRIGSTEMSPDGAFDTEQFFKGSLQDIQINGESVVLHHPKFEVEAAGSVQKLDNVLEGSISDDVCGKLEKSLCKRGFCRNTFNDYECICEKGYYGRNCDLKDFCVDDPCPKGGDCQNVDGGYICTSPVTLVSKSELEYELTGLQNVSGVDIDSLEFNLRTHTEDGHLMTLITPRVSLSLSLAHGQLVVSAPSPYTVRRTVADGRWHHVRIDNKIMKIDNGSYGLPRPLSALATSAATLLIGTSQSFNSIEDVKIGNLPKLSFYRKEDFEIPGNLTYLVVTSRKKIATTCHSTLQCGKASPCLHDSDCIDLWNKVKCACREGFMGAFCETNINECDQTECLHGHCVDGIGEASCECDQGWQGSRCDQPTEECQDSDSEECKTLRANDSCASRPCLHGICRPTETNQFKCKCELGYTGPTCSQMVDHCQADSCSLNGKCSPIWNGTMCECGKHYRGATCSARVDECAELPCQNDAECLQTELGYKCNCRKYYLGDRCEVEGSCLKKPCVHGECLQLAFDKHSCSCHKGYEGDKCDIKIDYCKRNHNPCKNGASCEAIIGDYKCHCIPGFSGLFQ
ncbi:hypothetical protein WR25_24942 isoform B [Diploscapter pachys]|uniref:Uncharacterized protein n=1 Tax=Diploscapter pachys TaxID=2018661 RepID=A0A2A2J2L6_9BILA|nr:hypothetical protein WR25_24942 isoform A [Diploscapter pachys]PAV55848.1 hypothetical protein WR25_24942 isoform B [Diploscapter pachys]